jgi:hypothetical protein
MPGVRGFVNEGDETLAVYFIEPCGMANFPMLRLGLVIGPRAVDAIASDRISVAFSCRPGPVLNPIDPHLPTFPEVAALGVPLLAEQTSAHPDAARFHAIAKTIIADDPRLGDMRPDAGPPRHRVTRFRAD